MRTVTYTMEDALISPEGFMILSGAGLVQGSDTKSIIVHTTERVLVDSDGKILVSKKPYVIEKTDEDNGDYIYVMVLDNNGDIKSEPYLYEYSNQTEVVDGETKYVIDVKNEEYTADAYAPKANDIVFVDYYTEKGSTARQIDITPDKFGGNFYLEASTLFRNTDGVDMPAEFIIPNCKIQSNFTFTMASSGDPSEIRRLAA